MKPESLQAIEALMGLFNGFKTAMRQTLIAQNATTVPPMVLRVLHLCATQPGITQQALVEHTGRDKAQIARLVKVLLEEGLLERRPHPDDKRSHCLWPTPAAAPAVRAFTQAQVDVAAALFGDWDAKRLQALTAEWQTLGSKLEALAASAAATNADKA